MVVEKNTYSGSTQNTEKKVLGQLSFLKLILLCLVSFVLCAVGPLVIFSPIPLAMAFLMYGFVQTFSVALVAILASMALSVTVPAMAELSIYSVIMVMVTIVGFMVSTIVVRGEHPVKGFILRGLVSLSAIGLLVFAANVVSQEPLTATFEKQIVEYANGVKSTENYQSVIKNGGDDARQIEQFMSNPVEVLRQFYNWIFSLVFVLVFFVLWLSTFTVMRNKSLWQGLHNYKYGLSDFVKFKVPDFVVYFVIIGFGLFVGSEYLGGETAEVVGGNILLGLGVLYFFQGMGIYVDLLRYLKIFGLLRNLLTIMTIFYGYQFVAIAGLFDTWVNFRKYFKKK